ncbi:hypothetical protein TNCV_2016051 [Trichonephila clavipes]|nr:hypothetical protein TNCV_2016051 [Trichonephila clavipes]
MWSSDLVIKVTVSCLACHFEPSTDEHPPCRGDRCTLNLPGLERVFAGLMLGGVKSQVTTSNTDHLNMVQSYEVRRPKPSCSRIVQLKKFTRAYTTEAMGKWPRARCSPRRFYKPR